MTDIRKHGFESDQQWREYLAEIEETTIAEPVAQQRTVKQELGELRAQVDRLRARVHAHVQHRKRERGWRTLAAGAALLLLTAIAVRAR